MIRPNANVTWSSGTLSTIKEEEKEAAASAVVEEFTSRRWRFVVVALAAASVFCIDLVLGVAAVLFTIGGGVFLPIAESTSFPVGAQRGILLFFGECVSDLKINSQLIAAILEYSGRRIIFYLFFALIPSLIFAYTIMKCLIGIDRDTLVRTNVCISILKNGISFHYGSPILKDWLPRYAIRIQIICWPQKMFISNPEKILKPRTQKLIIISVVENKMNV